MQQKLFVSKHTNADVHQSFPSHIASSKSNKSLDYQLKEKEAQLIKSKLPIEFLLINLQNDELRKYQQEYKGNALKNGLFVSKPDIMQQKKNEKKSEAKEKGRNSHVMNMYIKESYGLKYFQRQEKSMREESLIGKPPTQNKTEKKDKNASFYDAKIWGDEPALVRYQNQQRSHFYKQNNLIAQTNKEYIQNGKEHQQIMQPQNFSQIYNPNVGSTQSNHEPLHIEYPYLDNYHENYHFFDNLYQIPFLQTGELRYNQKYFQPKEEQSMQKNHLFRLFGLPFNEKYIEAPKLNDIQKLFCLNILHRLRSHQSSQIFRNPVSPQTIPDYHYLIYQPMDLGTIYNKIIEDSYKEISEFHFDINKIIASSYKYNQRGSPFFIATIEFQDCYFQILKQVKKRPEEFIDQLVFQKIANNKQEKDGQSLMRLEQKKKWDSASRTESNGKSEKNLKSTKISKQKAHEDENSQIFYQEMISQPNFCEYQHENMINHISAESQRKGNVMVHHRNYAKNNSNHAALSYENYEPHQSYLYQNKSAKVSPDRKNNKSVGRLHKKGSAQKGSIEEIRKQVQKNNLRQIIDQSNLIKAENEKVQGINKKQQKQSHQRNEQQQQSIESLKNFKFDLDENAYQSRPSQNKQNTQRQIQKPSLFLSQCSFDKLERLQKDQRQTKNNNKNTTQDIPNVPIKGITRKPSRSHIPKEDDGEQYGIPSKIQLFDSQPNIKNIQHEQTNKIELSIPLEAIRMIQEMDKEQQQKQNALFFKQQIQSQNLKDTINKKSSKGELLEYFALLDTESNKYKNMQKQFKAPHPQINVPLQEAATHLHPSNLGNFNLEMPYQVMLPHMATNGIPKQKKKKRIANDQEYSDQSAYDQFLQKQLQKLNKSKKIQKIKSDQFYMNNSSSQQIQKRPSKGKKREPENVVKVNSQPKTQQIQINVNKTTTQKFYNFPSQTPLEEARNKFLANQAKNNVEAPSIAHTSQQHNSQGIPIYDPKDIFIEKDQEKDNVEEPGIDFIDFFS